MDQVRQHGPLIEAHVVLDIPSSNTRSLVALHERIRGAEHAGRAVLPDPRVHPSSWVSAVNRPPRDVHCVSLSWTDALSSGRTHTLLCLCQLASDFGKGGLAGCPSASPGATSR